MSDGDGFVNPMPQLSGVDATGTSVAPQRIRRSGIMLSKSQQFVGPTCEFDNRESKVHATVRCKQCCEKLTEPLRCLRKRVGCLLVGEICCLVTALLWSTSYVASTQLWGRLERGEDSSGIPFAIAQVFEVVASFASITAIVTFYAGNIDLSVVSVLLRQFNVLTIFAAGATEVVVHCWRDIVLDIGGRNVAGLALLHLGGRFASNCVGLCALVSFIFTDAAMQISQTYRLMITLLIVPAKLASYCYSYFDTEVILLSYDTYVLRYGSIVRICESQILTMSLAAVKVILFDRTRRNLAFPSVPMRRPRTDAEVAAAKVAADAAVADAARPAANVAARAEAAARALSQAMAREGGVAIGRAVVAAEPAGRASGGGEVGAAKRALLEEQSKLGANDATDCDLYQSFLAAQSGMDTVRAKASLKM